MSTETRRGTTNRNVRGSSYDRRARKLRVLAAWNPELGPTRCRCVFCGRFLGLLTLSLDRIIPGCLGGRYTDDNVRPACLRCNAVDGGRLGASRRVATRPTGVITFP